MACEAQLRHRRSRKLTANEGPRETVPDATRDSCLQRNPRDASAGHACGIAGHSPGACRPIHRAFPRTPRGRTQRLAAHAHELPACPGELPQKRPAAGVEGTARGSFPALPLRANEGRSREADRAAALRGAADFLPLPHRASRAEGQPAQAGAAPEAGSRPAASCSRASRSTRCSRRRSPWKNRIARRSGCRSATRRSSSFSTAAACASRNSPRSPCATWTSSTKPSA